MFTTHRLSSLTLGLLLVGSLAIAAPARPAVAATLTITSLSCETRPAGLLCEGWVSGGTGGNTYTWNGRVTGTSYPDHAIASFGCAVGTTLSITFKVRDSSGATASKTISKYCSGGNP